MQLETLFHMGEFEYSLVHAHQGYQKYPTAFFEHGIMQGNETIENCIGVDTAPNALKLLSSWIKELVRYRLLMIEKLNEEVDELAGKISRCYLFSYTQIEVRN